MEKVNIVRPEERRRPQGNRKKPRKKAHGADFALRIVAVFAAILVWFILSITQYPTITRTINNIPVSLSLEDTIAKEKGLSALNFKDITVDVEIKGMNYEIGTYTAGDLTASVNVSKVTKEGDYKLEIDVKSNHSTDSCTIVSVSPSTVPITFDRITEKKIPLQVDAANISPADGFTLKDATVTPEQLTVKGAENSLEKINKAVAKINKTQKLKEDTDIKADEIVLYDKDNNVISDPNITMDEGQNYTAHFVVYKKKVLKLQVAIQNVPENFDVTSLPVQYSQNEITISTPKLDDNDTETVTVGSIPLSSIRLGTEQTFDIPLSAGEVNLSGESKVTVKFDSELYTASIFKVSRIITTNKPDGKKVTVETRSLPTVTIIGPRDEMQYIQENDLVATVDMADITRDGSYSKIASISVSGHNTMWCYGTNEVQVVVSDPVEDSSSDTEVQTQQVTVAADE